MQSVWHQIWFWRRIDCSQWKCTNDKFNSIVLSCKGAWNANLPTFSHSWTKKWGEGICSRALFICIDINSFLYNACGHTCFSVLWEHKCVLSLTLSCASQFLIVLTYHVDIRWERTLDKQFFFCDRVILLGYTCASHERQSFINEIRLNPTFFVPWIKKSLEMFYALIFNKGSFCWKSWVRNSNLPSVQIAPF